MTIETILGGLAFFLSRTYFSHVLKMFVDKRDTLYVFPLKSRRSELIHNYIELLRLQPSHVCLPALW